LFSVLFVRNVVFAHKKLKILPGIPGYPVLWDGKNTKKYPFIRIFIKENQRSLQYGPAFSDIFKMYY